MQRYTSADTSINVVNKVYNKYEFNSHTVVLDYGGGRFDANTRFMKGKGVDIYVYDKYNRTKEHNRTVRKYMKRRPPDYVVCSNVLNVIYEDEIIDQILQDIAQYTTAKVLFSFYEGDGSGKGKETTKGYQRNQKSKDYIPMINKYFDITSKQNGIYECVRKSA